MFYREIHKGQLEDFLEELYESIDFNEWHDAFPSVIGYEQFLPVNFEEAEENHHTFRSDDQVIASEIIKYPEFQDKMVSIVELITEINTLSQMWELYDDEEYPGTSFAYVLALRDINYLDLYSTFILSVKPEFPMRYLEYDIVGLIKKWNWGSGTHYLLLAYWFSGHKEKYAALSYLFETGFTIDLKEDSIEYICFIQTLKQFMSKSGYAQDELQNKYQELFEELTETYIYPNDKEKAAALKNRYHEIVEKLLHDEIVSELPEETNTTATVDIFQQYKDEDIAEI